MASFNIKVYINRKPAGDVQAIKFGASLDDIVIEAKIICAVMDGSVEKKEDQVIAEVEGVGYLMDIKEEGEYRAFYLQMVDGSHDYFKRYYT